MNLTVFERLLLRNIVPQIQGWNYAYLKQARELIEGLFTEQEEKDFQFEQEGQQVKWKVLDAEGKPLPLERDIPISDGLKAKIGKYLTQLNSEERLGFEHMGLYEKFVPEKEAKTS